MGGLFSSEEFINSVIILKSKINVRFILKILKEFILDKTTKMTVNY